MDFTILGPTQLLVKGEPINIGVAKQRALLTLLLANVGRPVPVDMIMDQLWPGQMHERIRGYVQTAVSRLRLSLEAAPEPCPIRLIGRTAYILDIAPQRIDLHRFRHLVDQAHRAAADGDHAAARRHLGNAIGLWRGTPLLDLQTDWATRRREQLEIHELLPAHHALIESEIVLREFASASNRLVPLLDEHPLDENLAIQWLRTLHGLGRTSEATAFGSRYRQRVLSEWGAEPSPAFQSAFGSVVRAATPDVNSETRSSVVQLPRAVSNLIGRDVLLAELDRIFIRRNGARSAPVVALHGPPGIGKTSLAVYWSHLRCVQFRGLLYLDFRSYGQGRPVTAEDAMAALLDQFGVAPERIPVGSDQRRAELGRLLAGREFLMVLENVRWSSQVQPLLQAAGSSCPILITSRGQLDGLAVFNDLRPVQVPPLSTADSVAMLELQVGLARADADHAALATLAELSGGFPLVLKVIAQNVAGRPNMRLADFVTELGGRSGLVAFTAATDDPDATVYGAFASSVAALPASTSRLFRALGLHPEPAFGRRLAAALLAAGSDEVDEHLHTLVKANLLESDGAHRYRFHDLLHAFARAAARREDSAESRTRVLTRMWGWYCATAANAVRLLQPEEQVIGAAPTPEGVVPMSFDSEERAFQWCVEERANMIGLVGGLAEHGLHDLAWRIPSVVGEVIERLGHRDDFLEALRVALDSVRRVSDPEAEICLLNFIGGNHFSRQRYREAKLHFHTALAVSERAGHVVGLNSSRHNLASAHLQMGEIELAITVYDETLRAYRDLGDRLGEAWVLHQLGSAYRRKSRYEIALRYYLAALGLRQEAGSAKGQGETLVGLGALYYQQGRYDLAAEHCVRALDVQERNQDRARMARTLIVLAGVHHDSGRPHDAIAAAERAVEVCRDLQDGDGTARALHVLGHGLAATGETERASGHWAAAVALLDESDAAASGIREDLVSWSKVDTRRSGCNSLGGLISHLLEC